MTYSVGVDQQERWYLQNFSLQDQVIADVGANVGRLSQFFWDHGKPTCRLVSIEPEPNNIQAIEARIREAGSDRWTLEACAVSAFAGEITMLDLDTEFGRNSMVSDAGERVVACERLEVLVPDATIVKLDIEGHEYAVLPSAISMLTEVRVWALELHQAGAHRLEQVLGMLVDHGFTLAGAGRRRDEPSGEWLNAEISPSLSWDQVPGMQTRVDGLPGVSKMLHVIAQR